MTGALKSIVNRYWYELKGEYYISCLTVPTQKEKPIGIWGRRHLQHIKKERKTLYTELLTSGRLNTYLADINEQATEQMLLLTKQMAEREGVTEQLKAQDQMLWVQRMNNIRDRVMEILTLPTSEAGGFLGRRAQRRGCVLHALTKR